MDVTITGGQITITDTGVYTPRVVKAESPLQPDTAVQRVVKAAEESRYTLGVAYPAMKTDAAVAQDGHIDFVSHEVLVKEGLIRGWSPEGGARRMKPSAERLAQLRS